MHILHYLDEIRPADEIPELKDIQRVSPDSKKLSLGKLLVENLSSQHLDLSNYSDAYTKELEKLITPKQYCIPVSTKPVEKVQETQDLVAALKASLQPSQSVRETEKKSWQVSSGKNADCGQKFLSRTEFNNHVQTHFQTHLDKWSDKAEKVSWRAPDGLNPDLYKVFKRYNLGEKAMLRLWRNGQLNTAIRETSRIGIAR